MSFGTFLAIALFALFALGASVVHWSYAPERKRLREIDEKEAAAKARDEQAGRDRAQRDYEKLQFKKQLEGLLQGHVEPDRQYGIRHYCDTYKQFPAIYKLLEAVREVNQLKLEADDLKAARNAYRKNITLLQGQLDDLHKAIGTYTG